MLKNYFKTAYRNLLRNKSYAVINVLGLAVGISSCLIIFLVIQFETSFDTYHKKKDRIYRLVSEFKTPEGVFHSSGVPFAVATALRTDFQQLEEVAQIFGNYSDQITIPAEKTGQAPKKFKEITSVYFADPQFFRMFDFNFLSGDINTIMQDPNAAVISKSTAIKYFGAWESAVGKTIIHDNKDVFKITGIFEDVPANSDFPLKVVVNFKSFKSEHLSDWKSVFSQNYCFVLFPERFNTSNFNNLLYSFVKKHKPEDYTKELLKIQPLSEIHFDGRFGNYRNHTFSKELINALSLIALFLLIIACVNFINLATAQAVNRSKEVGVRKVLGSFKWQLVSQFLTETALITLTAVIASLAISFAAIPFINNILDVELGLNVLYNPVLLLFLAGVIIFVTLISGIYPSFILSNFNPITALKNKFNNKVVGGISLRRGLVVLQFTIAQVLIIGMLIVVSQMEYFRNAFLGFDKDSIVNVPIPEDSISRLKYDIMKYELKRNPDIESVSLSFASPAEAGNWSSNFNYNNSAEDTEFGANLKWADIDYFKTYNISFVEGRPFQKSDTVKEYVVNETLVRKLGVKNPKDVLGKEIKLWGGFQGKIVGVVRDFHANSLRDPISPVLLASWKNQYRTIGIKIKNGKLKETLAFIENLWNKNFPAYVYEHQFLDQRINDFYREEAKLSQLYKLFAGVSIFISCLGLYGLMSFMAVQRTKEVGIRKTLGASVSNIIYLFSKEFTLLIIVAFVIASPIAYFLMHKWLENFTYKIEIGFGIFFFTILASLLISWLAVGYRAVKAAVVNPVQSLRSE